MPQKPSPGAIDNISNALEAAPRPSLTLDVSLYEEFLKDSDLSESKKQEFFEALWLIIVSFVDLGFEVHPLQQANEAVDITKDILQPKLQCMVESSHYPKTDF